MTHLPSPRLQHLRRLTDDTGMIQHALGPLPHPATGYTADDNARGLLAALQAAGAGEPAAEDLARTYLSFLAYAQRPSGWFHNAFGYDRRPLPEEPSEDCQARCLWALAAAARFWSDTALGWSAAQLFGRGLHRCERFRHPRGWAGAAVAAATWLDGWRPAPGTGTGPLDVEGGPPAGTVRAVLIQAADRLVQAWAETHGPDWDWFEDMLTYDNALLPYALLMAARAAGEDRYREVGLRTLEWLAEVTFRDRVFWPIGNAGWYPRGGPRAEFDQQPLEAGMTVLACLEAWLLTGDRAWAERAWDAAAWFVGRNALGLSLYDEETGGCRDGLGPGGLNRNEGAESTLAWLMAAYALVNQTVSVG